MAYELANKISNTNLANDCNQGILSLFFSVRDPQGSADTDKSLKSKAFHNRERKITRAK